jgi:hypothetical protein
MHFSLPAKESTHVVGLKMEAQLHRTMAHCLILQDDAGRR